MNNEILQYISYLTDELFRVEDDISDSVDTVKSFFEDYYKNKSIKESNEMLERYQNMSKADKSELNSEFERLNLQECFNYEDFQSKVKQANENNSKLNSLSDFFNFFQDNDIQLALPLFNTDDDINDSNPNFPTLIQQFNFYNYPNLPIGYFLDSTMISSLKSLIKSQLFEKLCSIGSNVFEQYILKKFIVENPEINLEDFQNYINDNCEDECTETFSDENFINTTLSMFRYKIYDPFLFNNPSISRYDYETICNQLNKLFKKVNSSSKINFNNMTRALVSTPLLDKIADSYKIFLENKEKLSKCPFFSFELIEKEERLMKYINSKLTMHSIYQMNINQINTNNDYFYILQSKPNAIKYYFSYIDLILSIILTYSNPDKNIYDIILRFFNEDNTYSVLKKQVNSCVFGEKKEAIYTMIFIIDCLKYKETPDFKLLSFKSFNGQCMCLSEYRDDIEISNLIDIIANNRQFFNEIIDGAVPDASYEYQYVLEVQSGRYVFSVDLNGVTLEAPDQNDPNKLPTLEYVKLKLISSSLNITMFENRDNINFTFQKDAENFVATFQLCEKLKSELKLLSTYYDERCKSKLTFKLENVNQNDDNQNNASQTNDDANSLDDDDDDDFEDSDYDDDDDKKLSLIDEIKKIENARLEIEKIIDTYYVGPMTYFTKEDLCLSFSYALKKDKENLKSIILSTVNKVSIRNDDFICPLIDTICSEVNKIQPHSKKFEHYFVVLNNFMAEILTKQIYQPPKVAMNEKSQILIMSCKRKIMEKSVSAFKYIMHEYLPDIIFDLYFSFQNEMPNYNQMLVCTKETAINRVSSFLKFYAITNKTSENNKLFLLINPQNLETEASEYVLKNVRKFLSEILGKSRLVILSTTQSDSFIDSYRYLNIDDMNNLIFDYNPNFESLVKTNLIDTYMIYTQKPRVGKSHLIMKTIFDNFENNVYHRIIVDQTTTLTKLIHMLKQCPLVENSTICYHFNIEGSENEDFTLFIIMLFLFRSLNDGFSSPFVLSNKIKTVFFFEFGAHPPLDEKNFINTIFPIGKYMKKLQLPPDRDFFSFTEYVVDKKDGISRIYCKPNNRKHLMEASALIEMHKKYAGKLRNRYFNGISDAQMRQERDETIEQLKKDPGKTYDNLMALFKEKWIPDQYRKITPLISQLDDVSHVIVNLIQCIFTFEYVMHEKGFNGPIRFMALTLAFETAIINCGLPYIYPEKDEIEIDKIRLERIINWIDNAERILVVTGLNFKDGTGIRAIQHHINNKKSICSEFKIRSEVFTADFVYTPESWKKLEQDSIQIFQIFEALFSLKRVNYFSTYTSCILSWDNLSNNEKNILKEKVKNNKNYFKQLKSTPNCNPKKNPDFYPPKPSNFCKNYIEGISKFISKSKDVLLKHKDDFLNAKNIDPNEGKDAIIDAILGQMTHDKLIDLVQQHVLSNSLLRTYSLTLHNVEMFLHIVYRIYSRLPIIMLGETGSGKTYSIKLLKEVIGANSIVQMRCFDGGTEEDDIKKYVHSNIESFKKQIPKNKEDECQIIFFFDEVNTAPCQWFIKELITDRFLDGEKIPDYVKFICAINPKRKLPDIVKSRLRGLEPQFQNEISNLVYKVRQIPESFVPYLFSADAPRTLPKTTEDVLNYDDLSEFEKVCEKVIDEKMDIEFLSLFPKRNVAGEDEEEKDEQSLKTKNKKDSLFHFSESKEYSQCFDFKFFSESNDAKFKELFKEDTSIKTHYAHAFISRLNAYAGRLFINKDDGFYKDDSFMSIREPERCVHLMRWFYKKGISDFSQKSKSDSKPTILFRKSFLLAFAATYWLRLSDFRLENQSYPDRDLFIRKIIKKWEQLIKVPEFQFLKDVLRPPTYEEWINDTIKDEQMKYANLFVSDDEGLSKNSALCENIWASYISLSNNIPLWIIGRPGTSKSLAVNIVLAKLFTGRTISNIPSLVYQTFMCSSDSRSEALISQMSRIAEKAMFLMGNKYNHPITALLLEEIGHADLSPYLPLKCLNHVIDDGFKTVDENGKTVILPITLIGLSNYKMDSAKLNRGILIIRDELSEKEKEKTAIDIFSSTALSLFKATNEKFDESFHASFVEKHKEKIIKLTECYHNSGTSNKFIGLRDFYGEIKLVTNVLYEEAESNLNRIIYAIKRNFSGDKTSLELFNKSINIFDERQIDYRADASSLDLIRDNLNEDWSKLKNPLSRHMLLVTEGNSALSLLLSELKEANRLIYADNFSGLPDDEWISNDLKQFAQSMAAGETIIFLGNHPCFNSLYDVFNLRYETMYKQNFALISFAGDSFLVKVHKKFKVIIIMEESEYKSLSAPFLNRFEKLFLNYDMILSSNKKDSASFYETSIENKFKDFNIKIPYSYDMPIEYYYFGCYNQHHYKAIVYFGDMLKLTQSELYQLTFLSCQPSKLIVGLTKCNKKYLSYFSNILFELSPLQTSLLHLLYYYDNYDKNHQSLALKLFNYWKDDSNKLPGIQAMALIPFIQEFKADNFLPFGDLIHIQLSVTINERTISDEITKALDNSKNGSVVTLIEIQIIGENLQQRIFHLQAVLENLRNDLKVDPRFKDKTLRLHTIIMVGMSRWENNLSFVQSIQWPVIFLDNCVSTNLRPLNRSLKTIDISSLLFSPLKNIFSNDPNDPNSIDFNYFISVVKNNILLIYNNEKRTLLNNAFSDSRISNILKNYFKEIVNSNNRFNSNLLSLSAQINSNKNHNDDDDDDNEEEDNDDDNEDEQPWFITFLKPLSYPPPSIIEYLSVKLSRLIENIFALVTQTILSCSDKFKPDLTLQENNNIIKFIFGSNLFSLKLLNSISVESPQIYQIEYRYLNPQRKMEWQLFTYMWEIVFYNSNLILNPNKESKKEEEEEDEEEEIKDSILTPEILKEFFISQFKGKIEDLINTYITPDVILDSFYAAYILLICPRICVAPSDRDKFNNLINCIKKIINFIYGEKLSLTETMIILLNQALKLYFVSVFQCYNFLPNADQFNFVEEKDNENQTIINVFAEVFSQIIRNVFQHEFKNIIELKDFISFQCPIISSVPLEFDYINAGNCWASSEMHQLINILNVYKTFFSSLPNVTLNDSMWRNKKIKFDLENPPKSTDDIVDIINDVLDPIKTKNKIDEADAKKLVNTLVKNYATNMEAFIYH